MTYPGTPNPAAVTFGDTLSGNPQLVNDPSLAYPTAMAGLSADQQVQVTNAGAGNSIKDYLTALPAAEQPKAWAALNGQQQQLALASGYQTGLAQAQQSRVTAPENQGGKSWLSRIGGDVLGAVKTGVTDTVDSVWNAGAKVLSMAGIPLKYVQRAANTGILDITDLAEGNPISIGRAWAQAGSAPMTQDSYNDLVKQFGQPMMDLVRSAQKGDDPEALAGQLLAKAKADPANAAMYNQQIAAIQNAQNSPEFKQALIAANNHLISPGRIVTSWAANALSTVTGGNVDLYQHKVLYGLLSGPVDAMFDFQADPLMLAGKLHEEAAVMRRGIQIAENYAGEDLAKVGGALAEGAGEAAAGAEAGAEAGGVGGSLAGPEGTAVGGLVGGVAGAAGGILSTILQWANKGGSQRLAHVIAQHAAGGDGFQPIADAAAFQNRLRQVFSVPSVQRYFDGMGARVQTVMSGTAEGATEADRDAAAAAMKSMRRDYPRFAPVLDSLVEAGVTDAHKAENFFNNYKGFQLLTQGVPASRVPLMAARTQLGENIKKFISPGAVFDFLENGHKLTQDDMNDIKTHIAGLTQEVSPESRAAALGGQNLAEGTTAAQANLHVANLLSQAQFDTWRGKTATIMRRIGSKIPTFGEGNVLYHDGLDAEGKPVSEPTQEFTRFVKMFAPSFYADQVGQAYAAADLAGRKNIAASMLHMMGDSAGITKTAAGRDSWARVIGALNEDGQAKYTLTDLGQMPDGRNVVADPGKARPYTVMPSIKEFYAQSAKHGVLAHTVGWTNKDVVDSLVDKIWRPFVLIRPAFIIRSNIEEALNHILRNGPGDKFMSMIRRSAGNELARQQKEKLGIDAAKANQALSEHIAAVKSVYGDDATVEKLRAATTGDTQDMRTVADKWASLKANAQEATNAFEQHPGVLDPDHSRFTKLALMPITQSSRAFTAALRKVPVDAQFFGRGFKSSGAEIRDAIEAHGTQMQQLQANLEDARTNLSRATAAFEQKYGKPLAEVQARAADQSLTPADRRVAERQLKAHNDNVSKLRDGVTQAQMALDAHGDLPAVARSARDNMVAGWVDRREAAFFHFMGRMSLKVIQDMNPKDVERLWEWAQHPEGQRIMGHALNEAADRSMRNATPDIQPGKRAQKVRVKLDTFGTKSAAGDEGAKAWSWALEDQSSNPLLQPAMLHADDTQAAEKAVLAAIKAHPEWKKTMTLFAGKSDETVAQQAVKEVQAHLSFGNTAEGPGQLNRDLFARMIKEDPETGIRTLNPEAWTPERLQEIPGKFRPEQVFAPDSHLVEDNSKDGFYTRLVQDGFSRMGKWISFLGRSDQAVSEYLNARKVLQPWEEMYANHLAHVGLEEGVEPTAEEMAKAQAIAKDQAIKNASSQALARTLRFVDHPGVRSQAAVLMRNMAPFWRAEQGFLERWGQTFRYAPSALGKLEETAHFLQTTPYLHKDANGNTYMSLPFTRQMTRFVDDIGHATGLPLQYLPIPNTISGNILRSSPGFNVDFLKHPINGPIVTLPLQTWQMFTHGSTPDLLLKTLGGDQATTQAGQGFEGAFLNSLPSAIRPLMQLAFNQDQYRETATMQAIATIQSNPELALPTDATSAQKQAWLNRVNAAALGMALTEALFRPFDPMPITNEAPIPAADPAAQAAGLLNVKQEFNQMVKDSGGDYIQAYNYWVAAHPDEIPFLTGQSESSGGPSIPDTQQAFDWMQNNQQLIKDYPLAATYLIPQPGSSGDTFSFAPFQMAQQLGLVKNLSARDYLSKVQEKSNINTYYQMKDQEAQEIGDLSPYSAAAAQIRAKWNAKIQPWLALNPDVATYVNDSSNRADTRNQTVVQMVQMLDAHPELLNTQAGKVMNGFVGLFVQYQSNMAGIMAHGMAKTTQQKALTNQFDQEAQQIANGSPTGQMLYNSLFRDMEQTDIAAVGGI